MNFVLLTGKAHWKISIFTTHCVIIVYLFKNTIILRKLPSKSYGLEIFTGVWNGKVFFDQLLFGLCGRYRLMAAIGRKL